MKIFLLLVIAILIVYIGVQIRAYYRRREKILNDIIQFCNIFENDLRFNRNSVSQIVKDNISKFDKEFAKVLEAYISHGKITECKFLNKKEQDLLEKFLNSLGKSDEEGEIRNLNNYRTELMRVKEEGLADCKKYGDLSIKMSVIIGALVLVIFL